MQDPFLSNRKGLVGTVHTADWADFRAKAFLVLRSYASDTRSSIFRRYLFRGQSCSSWAIDSSFDRIHKDKSPKERDDLYDKMITRFGKAFSQMTPMRGGRFDEFLAKGGHLTFAQLETIGQHYGMPTRLVDWSQSLYVAVFFALSKMVDCSDGMVAVWALDSRFTEIYSRDSLELRDDIHEENQRQLWQVGKFVRNKTPVCDMAMLFEEPNSWVSSDALKGPPLLIKMTLPETAYHDAMDDLEMMRISSLTLFPGLEGVVRWMNRGGVERANNWSP